jgi:uncharacterized membrane protein
MDQRIWKNAFDSLVLALASSEVCVMKNILVLILITLIPTLELRASIPFGILRGAMPWWGVVLVCMITNFILGPLVYLFLDKAMVLLLRFEWVNRIYQRTVAKTQRRIEKSVDRYGEMGVALFIGIPLPGTGSYSGALGAYLIGLGYRKFIIANVIGVLIAGVIVTTIVLSGVEVFRVFIKVM